MTFQVGMSGLLVMIACVLLVFAFGMIWLLICGDKTLRQRNRLIENSPDSPDPLARAAFWKNYTSVSFHDHTMALFWLRDPKLLYSDVVRGCWDRPWTTEAAKPPLVEDRREYLKAISELSV